MLLHGQAHDIGEDVLPEGDPEDARAAFDEDEDGFITVMEQCILLFCPRAGAKSSDVKGHGYL